MMPAILSDIIKAIAQKSNFDINIINMDWKKFETSLEPNHQKRDCDMWISGISITPKREALVDFSNPYLSTYNVGIVLDNPQNSSIQTLADLKSKKVSVQAATVNYDTLVKLKDGSTSEIVPTSSQYLAFKELLSGNVDASLGNVEVIKHFSLSVPDVKIREFQLTPTKKLNTVLLFQKAIQNLSNKLIKDWKKFKRMELIKKSTKNGIGNT